MTRTLFVPCLLLAATACSSSSPVGPSSVRASTTTPAASFVSTPARGDATAGTTPDRFDLTGRPQMIAGQVIAEPGVEWTLTSDVSWIRVETPSGRGPTGYSARVEANLCTSLPRTGRLEIEPGGAAVIVRQDGTDVGACP